MPEILASPAFQQDGLLIVTFDESASGTGSCCGESADAETINGSNTPNPSGDDGVGDGGGQVGAVLVSPYIQAGTVNQTSYNHYSMLGSIEDLFGLGRLGFAGVAGLPTFGSDVFDRTTPVPPPGSLLGAAGGGGGATTGPSGTSGSSGTTGVRCAPARIAAGARGKLRAGTLIARAVLVRRGAHATLLLGLRHAALVRVRVRVGGRERRLRRFAGKACKDYTVPLPRGAARVSIAASIDRGAAHEQRTLRVAL